MCDSSRVEIFKDATITDDNGDSFELLERLGEGGMGVVYKARQVSLDRIVAIKLLHRRLYESQSAVERLKREARATARLNHPSIVQVFRLAISKDGALFLLMEFIEGTTLEQLIRQQGKLDAETCQKVFNAILNALQCAHENGLLHRDLKPSNIMLGPDHTVKLMDFGLVKAIWQNEQTDHGFTVSGTLLGTPLYMSPEQCLNEDLDERSDIYSLTCVLYEALTGFPPFQGNSPLEIMTMHTKTAVDIPKEVPRRFRQTLMMGLAKKRAERPRSAAEFRRIFNETDYSEPDSPNAIQAIKSCFPKGLAVFFGMSFVVALIVFFMNPKNAPLDGNPAANLRSSGTKDTAKTPYELKLAAEQLKQIWQQKTSRKCTTAEEWQNLYEKLNRSCANDLEPKSIRDNLNKKVSIKVRLMDIKRMFAPQEARTDLQRFFDDPAGDNSEPSMPVSARAEILERLSAWQLEDGELALARKSLEDLKKTNPTAKDDMRRALLLEAAVLFAEHNYNGVRRAIAKHRNIIAPSNDHKAWLTAEAETILACVDIAEDLPQRAIVSLKRTLADIDASRHELPKYTDKTTELNYRNRLDTCDFVCMQALLMATACAKDKEQENHIYWQNLKRCESSGSAKEKQMQMKALHCLLLARMNQLDESAEILSEIIEYRKPDESGTNMQKTLTEELLSIKQSDNQATRKKLLCNSARLLLPPIDDNCLPSP